MKRASRLPQWPPYLPLVNRWLRWHIIAKVLIGLATTAILTLILSLNLDYYRQGMHEEPIRVGMPAPYDITAPSLIIDWDDNADPRDAAPARYTLELTVAHAQLESLFLKTRNYSADSPDAIVQDLHISAQELETLQQLDESTWNHLQDYGHTCIDGLLDGAGDNGLARAAFSQRISDFSATVTAEPDTVRLLFARLVENAISPALRPLSPGVEKTAPARIIREREIIIPAGRIISAGDFAQLKAHGLLTPATLTRVPPLAALLLFGVSALGIYLYNTARAVFMNDRKLILLAGLIIMPVWVAVTFGGGNERMIGLIAIPAGAMAIAGLLGNPTAIASTLLIVIAAALPARNPFVLMVLTTGSALAGMMVLSHIWPTSRSLPAVLSLFIINLLLLLSMASMLPESGAPSLFSQLGTLAGYAGAGAVGASIVAVGSIYILARPFGITTHYRLMELSNPNEPLLRRMMHEAPGSYHSSVMVANIAEAAADALGADALLTRVSALYHDIGKLKRPAFFIENQAPLGVENVHQHLAPKLSYLILASHVKEGLEVARQYKLPEEVTQIIREHHGTTLAAYFYHRAMSEAGGQPVSEHEFRYPGPKPSTRESAIVMLSDSVQASVKSLKEPTPGRIENMVNDIINNRLSDGQLEDCDITLRDLRRLSDVFVRILTGLYTYTRIEYPDIKGEGTRTRAHVNSASTPPASEPLATTSNG